MASLYDPIAHGVLGPDRRVVAIDCAYATLLGQAATGVIGRSPLDFTHPEDRDASQALLDRAYAQDRPVSVVKRYLRSDGSAVRVCVNASRVGDGVERQLVFSCMPLIDSGRSSEVVAQYQAARLLLQALRRGKEAFGADLIANPATEILLALYLAEAEARPAVAQEIGLDVGLPWHLAGRWFRALLSAGHVEAERAGAIIPATPLRLTPQAHTIVEGILSDVNASAA